MVEVAPGYDPGDDLLPEGRNRRAEGKAGNRKNYYLLIVIKMKLIKSKQSKSLSNNPGPTQGA